MKKIKVLMLGWEYPPYWVGGLGTHCYHLTRALAKLPLKLYFITPHPIHKKIGNLEIVGLDISQKFKENGKVVVYGDLRLKKIAAFTKQIPEIIKKFDFDLIHCQDEHPIDASIVLKKISKKPLLLTIHSTAYDKSKKPEIHRFKIEKRGMNSADKIIAVSDFTKKIMIDKYKISSRKIEVVPNAVNQKKLPPAKKEGKKKYIIYLGRLTYQKGIPYLLEALAMVLKQEKNVVLLIVGVGHKPYVNKLKKKVNKLGLKDNVKFLGFVKDRDYYYRKAKIFVMPSVSEPFGITPLEAISNGTPAIISKQSGIAETLKNCIKIDYWDTDEWAKKILFLIRDKKAYDKLRKDGLKEVKNFTWKKIAEETLDVYKRMV